MERLAISLLCALACLGLLAFLPLVEQKKVLPRLPGETSITIHLTAARPAERQPVPRHPPRTQDNKAVKSVLIKPQQKKKRPAKVAAKKPASLQTVARPPASFSPPAPSSGEKRGENAPVVVEATPLYRSNPKPEYPPLARRRGQEGMVMLQVLVAGNGRVEEVTLERSSGFALLDNAALDAVKKWRFVPGTKNGHPAATRVVVPVHFQLQ